MAITRSILVPCGRDHSLYVKIAMERKLLYRMRIVDARNDDAVYRESGKEKVHRFHCNLDGMCNMS